MISLIECPRDALQGYKKIIPTQKKVEYYNTLLDVGFHTLDFGSFVSPKAVPQMADTKDVAPQLKKSKTHLLAITLNIRGINDGIKHKNIKYFGYAFSISETFQLRNANKTIDQSYSILQQMKKIADENNRELVVYLSMAFGNPYGDPWSPELLIEWAHKIKSLGIKIISLADTIGSANTKTIENVFQYLIKEHPEITWGAHFHAHPKNWKEKIQAAYENGCRRFDGAIKGYGGCPFAQDKLVGNIPTEKMIKLFTDEYKLNLNINYEALDKALYIANEIFNE